MLFAGRPLLKTSFKKHAGMLLLCASVLFSQALILLVLPLPLRYALDKLVTEKLDEGILPQLFLITGILLGLGLIASSLEYVEERVNIRLMNSVTTHMRQILLSLTFSRKQSFIDGKRKVDLLARTMHDVQNLEALFLSGNVVLVRAIPSLLFVVGAMFYINFQFAILIIALLPIFYFIVLKLSKHIKAWERIQRRRQNVYEQDLMQSYSSSSLIKSLNGEEALLQGLSVRQSELNESMEKTRHFVGLFNSSFSFSRHLLRALVILVGGWAILKGSLTLGTLFAFVTYLESMNRPIAEISNFISRYGKANASLERVEELYRELGENGETSGSLKVNSEWSQFRVNAMGFAYPQSTALFSNLNLNLNKNSLVALVGASGSGKSSFIRLLNRLLDPVEGTLSFDQQDLLQFDLKSLRDNVCVIAQDPFFLAASIRDNLLLAYKGVATDEDLIAALQAVNADGFVSKFPQGLDTLIGESGLQLSGGQAKRLSLARAFVRKNQSQIFVFDEPTSGLDPHSAALVMHSIHELSREKNLVMYSTHRLEEFKLADAVLFFAPGHNPSLSTHDDLLANDQNYQNLLNTEQVLS